ncbi:MAG: hypothetical protein R6V76_07005 [Desulfobacterales bacterium]
MTFTINRIRGKTKQMRFSSYQIHQIMQVYVDKLSNGKDRKELSCEVNPPSGNGEPVSKADSHIIAERIIKDITGRIDDICKSAIEPQQHAPTPLQGAWLANETERDTLANFRRFSADCGNGLQTGREPASGIYKGKDKAITENKNYVYNIIDESGKKISREISLIDSEFLIKNL